MQRSKEIPEGVNQELFKCSDTKIMQENIKPLRVFHYGSNFTTPNNIMVKTEGQSIETQLSHDVSKITIMTIRRCLSVCIRLFQHFRKQIVEYIRLIYVFSLFLPFCKR